eukprot:CAMPEP_0194476786 /NCGR_PEP_ID=MMETSP0253-20130528/629_1 /TAXON_ID=2966 /ORGANISM="Noctiluca scintillans" /LENGTH=49 /DNA_ID=CAMNT_0039315683 /DNA_START=1 /DNA_END=150 /DNA_ORIENTATION=-
MVNPIVSVPSMPKAPNATPNMPHNEWATRIVMPRLTTGMMVDKYPKARP